MFHFLNKTPNQSETGEGEISVVCVSWEKPQPKKLALVLLFVSVRIGLDWIGERGVWSPHSHRPWCAAQVGCWMYVQHHASVDEMFTPTSRSSSSSSRTQTRRPLLTEKKTPTNTTSRVL
jgi:hypothetical protein